MPLSSLAGSDLVWATVFGLLIVLLIIIAIAGTLTSWAADGGGYPKKSLGSL